MDVIVHGSPEEVALIAARHGVRIKKLITEGAVLQAKAAQIESLSAEVDHLSRDVEVTSFMSVTNEATGADQVQAGLAGLRDSPARASASRSSTPASGRAIARSPAASSLRKISSAIQRPA